MQPIPQFFCVFSLSAALCGCAVNIPVEPPPAELLGVTPTVPVRVMELSLLDIPGACRNAKDLTIAGCAYLFSSICIVVVPIIGNGGVTAETRKEIDDHEIYGHCNGMRHAEDRRGWFAWPAPRILALN